MTCREFKGQLHDFLDAPPGATEQAAARAHVDGCKGCRLAVQQAQQFGRVLHEALDRSAATVSLEADFSRRLLQSAPAAVRKSAGWPGWPWLAASPFRAVGAVACVGIVLFALLFSRESTKAPDKTPARSSDEISFSIDVPFQTDRHVGLTHAEFTAPFKR